MLISYGTGAIMAVPAHDTRDFDFAKQFALPIRAVVDPGDAPGAPREDLLAGRVAFIADGTAVNSGPYDGLPTAEFKKRIAADLQSQGQGRPAVNYKLRDWLFSRQHFWGEPFPILHELDAEGRPNGRIRALRPEDLPVDLPATMAFDAGHDRPEPPLEKAPEDWLYVTLDGKRYKRETNTMPQWAGSCWYYLRFLDPHNARALVDPAVEKAWMPVDLYVGGAEHAVLHLLYARFWHKVLFDRGYVSTLLSLVPEDSQRQPGVILGEDGGRRVPRTDVEEPRQRGQSRPGGERIRRRRPAALRDVHGPAGGREALEHGRRQRGPRLPGPGVADDRRRPGRGDATSRRGAAGRAHGGAGPHDRTRPSRRSRATWSRCRSTRRLRG